jgi:outer membrane lipoprotein-sorting protein
MSPFRKTLFAAAAALAVATPALAQDASPWDLKDRNAYVLDMQGKMWSTSRVGTEAWARMARRAKAVPRGTVFFMNNGRLYMAQRGMFDRAGNFMTGGG